MTFLDTLRADPRYASPLRCNDPALLEPVTRAAVATIIAQAAAAGHTLRITETYRSQARQAALFAQGATQLQHVGVHGYGLACDFVLIGPDGAADWSGADYTILRDLCAANGMIWGGDWGDSTVPHSFRDMDHVQRINVADQAGLFSGAWYPDADYRPTVR